MILKEIEKYINIFEWKFVQNNKKNCKCPLLAT